MNINTTLRYCNKHDITLPYKVRTHTHRHWEIVFYNASGVSIVNQVPYHVEPSSYVVIPADTPHKEIMHTEGILYCFGFDTDMSRDIFRGCHYTDECGSIERIVKEIVLEVQEKMAWHSYRVEILLQDIILQTMRKSNIHQDEPDERLNMLLNYLNAYCTTDIDFHNLAASMNYSYDYLRHFFKAQKKMSMKQYVTERRIFLSKEYLMADMPIKQIASKCGFSSSSHFASVFRQMTNMTPSEFRENSRNVITEGNAPIWQKEGEE